MGNSTPDELTKEFSFECRAEIQTVELYVARFDNEGVQS